MTATLTKKLVTSEVRVKDAAQGIVELVFSTFNKVDKDGDVTLKGAFVGNPPVVLSAYGHKSWDGELPYGSGTISETDTEAVADVKFLLETTHGRDAFLVVEELSKKGLQEWSYSLEDVESERGTFEGKAVRFLKKVFVKEISPVLRGVGTDTRTLDVKASERKQLMSMIARMLNDAGTARFEGEFSYCYLDDFDLDEMTAVFCVISYASGARDRYLVQVDFTRTDTSVELGDTETVVESTTLYLPKGNRFSEHADAALVVVKNVVGMAVERLAHRAAEGKSISEQTDVYDRLYAEFAALKAAIDEHTANPSADEHRAALDAEWLRFIASSQGVTT